MAIAIHSDRRRDGCSYDRYSHTTPLSNRGERRRRPLKGHLPPLACEGEANRGLPYPGAGRAAKNIDSPRWEIRPLGPKSTRHF